MLQHKCGRNVAIHKRARIRVNHFDSNSPVTAASTIPKQAPALSTPPFENTKQFLGHNLSFEKL